MDNTRMNTLIDIYAAGIEKFIQALNSATEYKHTNVFFNTTHRDNHVASRAIERKIDLIGLLTDAGMLLKTNLESIVEAANNKQGAFTVQTVHGNMSFRCWWNSGRNAFELKLCTITPTMYAHHRDFLIK
jgi:hypothetical protein